MGRENLQSKRYIALARCSTVGQIDTSIEEQLRLIEKFGRDQGMVCVDRITLGVTGSVPGARSDIEELISRKKEQDDFDVVVIQDASRLTRTGPAHGMHILFQLRSVGADIVSVKDDLPAGDIGDVMRTLQYYSAKQQADSIAFAATRGASASLNSGKTAHCKAPPYGIDRLYCSEDGAPRHVIRNLADGTQVKLHPESGQIIERFGRNEKTGGRNHYIKQKSERIRLVPGDPEHVRIVREIFEHHFCHGWGTHRIAMHLNDHGVPAPRGGQWALGMVRAILFNQIYVGIGIANISTTAIYYVRGADGPVAASTELKDLVNGKPTRRVRPQTEWVKREEPELAGILDPAVRDAASARQTARFESLATGRPVKRDRDRHADSAYFLKGILTAKQGGYPLTGRTTGPKNRRKRYYSMTRAHAYPTSDSVMRRLIPAEPVEQTIIMALQEVLKNCERVRELVHKIAEREVRAQSFPDSDLGALHRERQAIEQKLTFVLDELDSDGQDAVRAKVQQMQARFKELKAEIRRRSDVQQHIENPNEIADAICDRMSDLADQMPNLAPLALRNLMQTFVSKLVIDMETRHLEVEFALPDWATADADALCLVSNAACKTTNEAHLSYVLASYSAVWEEKERTYKIRQVELGRNAA